MSTEDIAATTVCKQRFKGLENFLKRIAFNLGNTPSQTEVKIISCIPIDVTDLQQKILHLEKQLEDAQGPAEPSDMSKPSKTSKQAKLPKSKRTSVNTAIVETKFPNVSTAAISCKSLDCDRSTSPTCLHHKRKSNVSFIFPEFETNLTSSHYHSASRSAADKAKHKVEHRRPSKREMAEPKHEHRHHKHDESKRNFFRKKKNIVKSKRGKSPCVYYAQTFGSPFNRPVMVDEDQKYDSSDVLSRSYLANMINKQYKPKALGDDLSLISQFSSPVCRDVQPHCEAPCTYESDICSCCHGPFHNIDERINKLNNPQTYMLNEMNTGNAYYDTNQYDLVPVKEKPVKIKKDLEMPRKKDLRNNIDMKCWPENVRTKYRYQSLCPLPATNNCKVRPRNEHNIRDKPDNYGRRIPARLIRAGAKLRKETKRRKEIYRRERPVIIETSKSCCIDFGATYPRKTYKKPKRQESLQPISISKKNAECLTTAINNNECQTTMSTAEVNNADAKTEATLNQIKSILQSVLEEVKISSQTRSQLIPEKHKKDAVVQKGPSQNNVQSSLINSFTYSPYTMAPSAYMASCSRQLTPSQFYYPQPGMKCFQNFPLFIQTPGRHMCASCFRNSSHVKSSHFKQATTTATNTDDVKENHSKETEKLIKEIYKSMALTVDLPNKDTSLSEYDEMTKSFNGFTTPVILKTEPKKPVKKIRNVVQAVSELFMKKDMVDTSDTLNTTLESKLPSNETSTRSQLIATTDTEQRIRKDRQDRYIRNKNLQPLTVHEENRTLREAMARNAVTITESETASSEGDTDTIEVRQDVVEPKHKKEKESLLSKMFKSVFKSREKTKKRGEKTESEEELTSSDSDDYQTVYSQRIEKTVRNRGRPQNIPKRKTHSKISYKQMYQRERSPDKKRAPYMEQEYRRYWDEHLMFHDNRQKFSSDRLYSDQTTPHKSAYYQTYEARRSLAQSPGTMNNSNENKLDAKSAAKGLAWLKKHKMGVHCGDQWKKLILES
ncbi:hypothetical protein B5X24_HaOG216396 [Helicoverpa armigera]|nr:hypothetical protein B5X24_HaOG216396 [Helicoverpa armigera]